MSNEIAKIEEAENALAAFGGLDTLVDDIVEAEDHNRAELEKENSGATQFVSFTPASRYDRSERISPWTYGREDIEIHPDSKWIVDINSMQHGWMGWERAPGGKLSKGQQPDRVLTPFNKKFPAVPADKPWCSQRTFAWKAICISSPIEGQVGTYIENADYRAMKKGYAELEVAVANRLKAAKRAKDAGNMAQYKELLSAPYPVIKFGFNLSVDVGANGVHNQGIIEFNDEWSAPIVVERDATPESNDAGTIEDKVVEAQQEGTATRRRRRE